MATDNMLSEQEQQDEELISRAFQRLIDSYLATNHRRKVELITRAFNFAKRAHKGVRRLSGEPYILHPIAVAQIVCEEIGLGSTSISAALLHDVEEDTDYTNEDIANLFGAKIANIVEGLTKISGGVFGDTHMSPQAETFKKLLLTMSDDIRVILIKIADRLHNMRTLQSMLPSKQLKIAGETLYIFAPLAARLGLNKIKTELENLSFEYQHPEEYAFVSEQLKDSEAKYEELFDQFTPAIERSLTEMGCRYTLKGRLKSPYSIWQKMQKKHVPFSEVYDLYAIRIVYTPKDKNKEIDEAYAIYAALTKIYPPHPTRFRDWLSTPKANGYQALHNTFMSKEGQWIEVQIRSERMDEIAEQGFAAHWKYKTQAEGEGKVSSDDELDKWLNAIKEILDDPQPDTLDFLDTFKLNLFASEILIFTPKGEIKTMPADSTVLDFAFSIHSFLGSHCIGAKVNHRLVPVNHRLESGDQVEVLTSRQQTPKPEWIDFAATAKAKGKIQAILRREAREKQRKGEKALNEFFLKHNFQISGGVVEKLYTLRGFANREEFLQAIGEGNLSLGDADINLLRGKSSPKGWRRRLSFRWHSPHTVSEPEGVEADFVKQHKKQTLCLDETLLAKCEVSKCCRPIPGDDVMAYVTVDHKLQIHKRTCPEAEKLKVKDGNNILAAKWDMHRTSLFDVKIYIKGTDQSGMLHSIAEVLNNELEIFVRRVDLSAHEGIFDGTLTVALHDTDDVRSLCNALSSIGHSVKAVRVD